MEALNFMSNIALRIDNNYNFYLPHYFTSVSMSDKQFFGTSFSKQKEKIGYLIRNITMSPTSSGVNQILYGNPYSEDYLEYTLFVSNNEQSYQRMRFNQLMQYSIVQDNTYEGTFGGLKGSVDIIDAFAGTREVLMYQR